MSKKCIVLNCANHDDQGAFVGDLCAPCHAFITADRRGTHSQAERNAEHIRQQKYWHIMRSSADDLRSKGVYVVNHYDLSGSVYWFMQHTQRDGTIIGFQGHGLTDEEALDEIRRHVAKHFDKKHHAPMCPANHYHGQRAPTGKCNCGAEETFVCRSFHRPSD